MSSVSTTKLHLYSTVGDFNFIVYYDQIFWKNAYKVVFFLPQTQSRFFSRTASSELNFFPNVGLESLHTQQRSDDLIFN